MPDTDRSPSSPARPGSSVAATAANVIAAPFDVARRLLPDNPVPVALGMGALAVAGIVEWPVAAAAGLGYAALRRWHR